MTATAQAARARAPVRRVSPRLLRDLHLYLAVFFAPAIVFFALTGVLQVLGLHEASRDGSYTPAPIVERLAQVHIHQRFAEPPRRQPPRAASGAQGAAQMGAAPAPAAQARAVGPEGAAPRRGPSMGAKMVKWFFAAAAAGLAISALLGVWIAVTQSRQRRLAWVLLGVGALIPVAMLAL